MGGMSQERDIFSCHRRHLHRDRVTGDIFIVEGDIFLVGSTSQELIHIVDEGR